MTPVSTSSKFEPLKQLARDNRTALKLMLGLYDMYRGDDRQLTGKDAQLAMQSVLRLMSDTGHTSSAAQYGQVSWQPDSLVFAEFFDQVGDGTLGDYLGIEDIAELPGADLEQRADAIRKQQITKKEEPPQPQLSSTHRDKILNQLNEGKNVYLGRGSMATQLHRAADLRKLTEANTAYDWGFSCGKIAANHGKRPSDPASGKDLSGNRRKQFMRGFDRGFGSGGS